MPKQKKIYKVKPTDLMSPTSGEGTFSAAQVTNRSAQRNKPRNPQKKEQLKN